MSSKLHAAISLIRTWNVKNEQKNVRGLTLDMCLPNYGKIVSDFTGLAEAATSMFISYPHSPGPRLE